MQAGAECALRPCNTGALPAKFPQSREFSWNKLEAEGVYATQTMTSTARFEKSVLPHLDAAYNLARWLTRDDQDAQDVVQEAYLRAFRYFHALRGEDARHNGGEEGFEEKCAVRFGFW